MTATRTSPPQIGTYALPEGFRSPRDSFPVSAPARGGNVPIAGTSAEISALVDLELAPPLHRFH